MTDIGSKKNTLEAQDWKLSQGFSRQNMRAGSCRDLPLLVFMHCLQVSQAFCPLESLHKLAAGGTAITAVKEWVAPGAVFTGVRILSHSSNSSASTL